MGRRPLAPREASALPASAELRWYCCCSWGVAEDLDYPLRVVDGQVGKVTRYLCSELDSDLMRCSSLLKDLPNIAALY